MTAPTDPAAVLLQRAAADGHTWLPAALVEPVLPSAVLAAAAGAGSLVRVGLDSGATGPGWADGQVAEAEDLLADGLAGLAEGGRLAGVAGPVGSAREAAVARLRADAAVRSAPVVVVPDADRLGLEDLLQSVEELPDDALLLLAGDPATLGPAGPGQPFIDLVAAEVCPVVSLGPDSASSPTPGRAGGSGGEAGGESGGGLAGIAAAVRQGRLTAPAPEDRSFVVVPVGDDAAAVRRAVQVATLSIPRAFGLADAQVAVLTPLVRGAAGRDALATALAGAGHPDALASTVHDAAGRRWPAVVLVLPPSSAGVLDRALLVAATSAAQQHLTVVHGVGPALAAAVSGIPRRTRRTRLAALLRSAIPTAVADLS